MGVNEPETTGDTLSSSPSPRRRRHLRLALVIIFPGLALMLVRLLS